MCEGRTRYKTGALLLLVALVLLALAGGCGPDEGGADAAPDGGGDTDTGSDSDPTPDCSECTAPQCLHTITGVNVYEGSPPEGAFVQICSPLCEAVPLDASGAFELVWPACKELDFFGEDPDIPDDPLHFIQPADGGGAYTRYAVEYAPTQDEIGADFAFDIGTHQQFALPSDGASYTAADGADVTDLNGTGVAFTVDAGGLGEESLTLVAWEADLGSWAPPFTHGAALDALYFLAPYFTESASGIALRIDPTSAGWVEGDGGTVLVLGDYVNGTWLSCDGSTEVAQGAWTECGAAEWPVGETAIVTEPIPLLGWVGLVGAGG